MKKASNLQQKNTLNYSKMIFLLTVFLLSILTVFIFSACNRPEQFTLTYTAGTGGTLYGNINQAVEYGADGTEVTAVPDTGYRFVKWSDNDSANHKRTDTNVKADINATAIFEKQIFSVKYVTDGNGTMTVTQTKR